MPLCASPWRHFNQSYLLKLNMRAKLVRYWRSVSDTFSNKHTSLKQTTPVVLQITLFVQRLGVLFWSGSSSGILRRLGDLPVITCRSPSRGAEGNVPLRVQPRRRSNVGFILQPERWDVHGCWRGRSTCAEHVARTVRHSGGGVPGRLSSGSPLTGVQ